HQRVVRHAPLIVDHRQIAVTNPAVVDRDLDLFIAERTRRVFEWLERSSLRRDGVAFDSLTHRPSIETRTSDGDKEKCPSSAATPRGLSFRGRMGSFSRSVFVPCPITPCVPKTSS